jgi:hypothetical protein
MVPANGLFSLNPKTTMWCWMASKSMTRRVHAAVAAVAVAAAAAAAVAVAGVDAVAAVAGAAVDGVAVVAGVAVAGVVGGGAGVEVAAAAAAAAAVGIGFAVPLDNVDWNMDCIRRLTYHHVAWDQKSIV